MRAYIHTYVLEWRHCAGDILIVYSVRTPTIELAALYSSIYLDSGTASHPPFTAPSPILIVGWNCVQHPTARRRCRRSHSACDTPKVYGPDISDTHPRREFTTLSLACAYPQVAYTRQEGEGDETIVSSMDYFSRGVFIEDDQWCSTFLTHSSPFPLPIFCHP